MKRRLSECERLYWYANAQSPGNVIAVAHVRGELNLLQLQAAADRLADKHPLLGVHVREEAPGDFWLVTEGSSLPHLQVSDHSDLDAIFEAELNTRLGTEPNAPPYSRLWRARIIRPSGSAEWVVVLTVSHMVCDASAMLLALRDWLDIYSQILDGTPEDAVVVKRWPERPAFDELLPQSFHAPGRALWHTARLASRLVRAQIKKPLVLRARTDVPLPQRTSSVLLHTLPTQQVEALHTQCRQQGVTLHGAWMAALALALRDVINGAEGKNDFVAFTTPTSLRHLLDQPIAEEVGCYVSMLHTFVNAPASQSFWDLARAANREVKTSLQNKEHLAGIQLGRLISPKSRAKAEKTLAKMAAQGGAGACVSNLGNFSMPSELGSLRLQQVYGFAALSFTGALLFGVLTINRRTLLCMSYVPAVIERSVVDQILSAFCAKLSEQAALRPSADDTVSVASA